MNKPKAGIVVNATIKSYSTDEVREVLLRSVDENDCEWRVYDSDGHEEEFNEWDWQVIGWTD